MLVVSNTSPILNLAIIRRLELLRQQFVEVLIPPAVYEELKPDSELAGAGEVQTALQSGWLRVAAPSNTALVQMLSLELDQGQAAAIALALEVKPEFILMDESEGRAKAAALGTIVEIYTRPTLAYEVEFVNADGSTRALVTLAPDQIRWLAPMDVLTTRQLPLAA